MIEVKNLYKSFEGKEVLKNINAVFENGKTNLIIGSYDVARKYLMALFTNTEALIEQSYHMMMILSFGYIAMEVTQCLQGIMRGAGDTLAPMWLSMISTVVIRVPLAYLMTWMTRSPENPNGQFYMMFVSLLVTWLIGAALTYIVYKAGRWKNKALV